MAAHDFNAIALGVNFRAIYIRPLPVYDPNLFGKMGFVKTIKNSERVVT